MEARWNLPNLETLSVSGSFHRINEYINYQETTIKNLELNGLGDMRTWSGISNDSILTLNIKGDSVEGLENLSLNSLKTLEVLDIRSPSFKLSNVVMPKVEKIEICGGLRDDTFIELSSIDAPILLELSLKWVSLALFKDVNAPSVICADLRIHPESEDTAGLIQILKNVKKLNAHRDSWWKYTPKLENLSIIQCLDQKLLQFKAQTFPHLKVFSSFNEDNNVPSILLLPSSPVLEEVVLRAQPDIYDLDKLKVYQKTLKVIYIGQYREGDVESKCFSIVNVQFPLLTDLNVSAPFFSYIELKGLQFPNLRILTLNYQWDETDVNPYHVSTIDVKAPKLEVLRVQHVNLGDVFEVSQYPKLTDFSLRKCYGLKRVVVLNCPELTKVQIDYFEIPTILQVHHDGSLDDVEINQWLPVKLVRI